MLATRAGLTPAVATASTRRSRMPSLARPHGARRAPRTVAVARASVSSSSGDEEVVPELLDEDDSRRNELEWDAQSSATGLSAQLRTTNALRERLSREMFHVKPEEVAPDVVYRSQVHEARGSEDYNALMTAWRPMIKRQLLDFTYDTERAFCPEAGVLLVRWRAEWEGAFNADAQMLNFIEENFPDYAETNAEEYARLKRDVDDPTNSRSFTGDREYAVRDHHDQGQRRGVGDEPRGSARRQGRVRWDADAFARPARRASCAGTRSCGGETRMFTTQPGAPAMRHRRRRWTRTRGRRGTSSR